MNSIDAELEFDFKGERFSPCVTIDLDAYFQADKDITYIYDLLAQSIGLNEHRHEYDVMVMHDVVFSQPQGFAQGFVHDGQVDWQGLKQAWQTNIEKSEHDEVLELAKSHFSEQELADNPKLLQALTLAYKQNKKA